MKRVSLHTRSFRLVHFSVLETDERKMALRARKVSGAFEKRAPGLKCPARQVLNHKSSRSPNITNTSAFTATSTNMRTLKFKAQPTNAFFLPSINCSAALSSFRLLPSTVSLQRFRYLNCAQRIDYRALDSSRKLGGVAEHLIDGVERRNKLRLHMRILMS